MTLPSRPGASYPGYRALMLALFGRCGPPPAWRADAACRNADPELFADPERTEDAKAVCADCPVRAECLADQLAWEARSAARRYHPTGVVGGLSAAQRRRIHYPPKPTKEVA
jgi:WhiB family redox-sensing transcriptional regulator